MTRVLHAWELLRTQHREMPAQVVTVLFYIASHNPCHKQAIEEDQELTTASCSRCIAFLTDGPIRPGVKTRGLGLVKKYTDPGNHRRFMCKLTPEGERVIHLFKTLLDD